MTTGVGFAELRVPNHGPKALIAAPAVFDTEDAARARIAAIIAAQLKRHHTLLEVFRFEGDVTSALDASGILY